MLREPLLPEADPAVTEPTNSRVSEESLPTNALACRLLRTNRSDELTMPAEPTPKLPELPAPLALPVPPIDVRVPAVTPLPSDRVLEDPVDDRLPDALDPDERDEVCWASTSRHTSPATNIALTIIQRLGIAVFLSAGAPSLHRTPRGRRLNTFKRFRRSGSIRAPCRNGKRPMDHTGGGGSVCRRHLPACIPQALQRRRTPKVPQANDRSRSHPHGAALRVAGRRCLFGSGSRERPPPRHHAHLARMMGACP